MADDLAMFRRLPLRGTGAFVGFADRAAARLAPAGLQSPIVKDVK